jgi:hypothetical protein
MPDNLDGLPPSGVERYGPMQYENSYPVPTEESRERENRSDALYAAAEVFSGKGTGGAVEHVRAEQVVTMAKRFQQYLNTGE